VQAILNTDGGARGNPGPAGIGVVLRAGNGDPIATVARGIGVATNNVAEYAALIEGLELALAHGVDDIVVRLDSELVVNQVNGAWKIKDEKLRPLAVRARALLDRFARSEVSHVRRADNAEADGLANEGMDEIEASVDPSAETQASLFDE
jgi:probable phosphoglycerate mutase